MQNRSKKALLGIGIIAAFFAGGFGIYWLVSPDKNDRPSRSAFNGGADSKTPLPPDQKNLAGVPLFELPWKSEPDVDSIIANAQKSSKAADGADDPSKEFASLVPFGPNYKPPEQNLAVLKPPQAKSGIPAAPTLTEAEKDALITKYMKQLCGNAKPTFDDWKILVSSKPAGLANEDLPPVGRGFVTAFCQDLQGKIWIGCEDEGWGNGQPGTGGVWCYDETAELTKQWQHFTRKNTGGPDELSGPTIETGNFLGDDNSYALACDKLGRIWVGHLNHGVSVYNGKEWKNYNVLEGPLGERVFAIATCPTDGDVWIATSVGLTRYSLSKDTWSYYTHAEGLPSDQVSAIAFDKEGNIILGTHCDGLAFASINDDYKIWRQVTGPKEFERRVPFVPNGQGLPTNSINDVLVSSDGTIYAATIMGLAWSKDSGKSFEFIRGRDWAAKVKGLYGGVPKDWQEKSAPWLLSEDYVTRLADGGNGLIYIGHWKAGSETFDPRTGPKVLVANQYIGAMFTAAGGRPIIGTYAIGITHLPQGATTPGTSAKADVVAAKLPSVVKPQTLEEIKSLQSRIEKIPANGKSVISSAEDWRTQGDWIGRYGRHCAVLCATGGLQDHLIHWGNDYLVRGRIGPNHRPNDSIRSWIHWLATENHKSLWDPTVGKRRQAEWDDHGEVYPETFEGPDLFISVKVPEGTHRMSLYFFNKDGHYGSESRRDFGINLLPYNPDRAKSLDEPAIATARINNFWGGVYKTFTVKGPAQYWIHLQRHTSFDALISGVFFDRISGPSFRTESLPMPFSGSIPRLTPPAAGAPKNPAMEAVTELWNTGDKSNSYTVKLMALRAGILADASSETIDNWRWKLNLWNSEDRRAFTRYTTSAWSGYQKERANPPTFSMTVRSAPEPKKEKTD